MVHEVGAPLPSTTRQSYKVPGEEGLKIRAANTVGDEEDINGPRRHTLRETITPMQSTQGPPRFEDGVFDSIVGESFDDNLYPANRTSGQEDQAEGDESNRTVQVVLQPEEVSRLRQLLAEIRPSSQGSSSSDSQVELQEIRDEMQRLRHLMVLQPSPVPQKSECDIRSWTTSLPSYDD